MKMDDEVIADRKICGTCGSPHPVNERCKWPVPPLLSVKDAATLARLDDDALVDEVAVDCHDPAHDPRWCPTCEARRDGIEDYRKEVRGE